MQDLTPLTPKKDTPPPQEGTRSEREQGDLTQAGGHGNAAALADQPPSDPSAEDPEASSGLRGLLEHLVSDPDQPATPGTIQHEVRFVPRPSRGAVFQDMGFWSRPFWSQATLEASEVRDLVDPLAELPGWLEGRTAEERAALVRRLLSEVPDQGPRLLTEARYRGPLLEGLGALGRVQVLGAITDPGRILDDPYLQLQGVVQEGDPEQLALAWSEASVDPARWCSPARPVGPSSGGQRAPA